jgi:hypothetical protein
LHDIILKFIEQLPAITVAGTGFLAMWKSLSTKIGTVQHTVNSQLDKFKHDAAMTAAAALHAAVENATLEAERRAGVRVGELNQEITRLTQTAATVVENTRRIERMESLIKQAEAGDLAGAKVLADARIIEAKVLADAKLAEATRLAP